MPLDTEELLSICNEISEGKSLRRICRERGYAESSVRYWIAQNEEAFAHSVRARELGCDSLADECLDIADDETLKPEDKRIKIDTRIRLIGKWSQRYGDKVTVKGESTVTHKYDLDSLSDDRLDQLEQILADASRGASGEGEAVASSLH